MTPDDATPDSVRLTHLSEHGEAKMVDVGCKPTTRRTATAEGYVRMSAMTLRALRDHTVPKGDVLATARVAGILAAKSCDRLIPLCHSLPLDAVEVRFQTPSDADLSAATGGRIRIEATATVHARTGVEMEALTAVSIAALTIYDMCKAIDRALVIEGIRLLDKTGGRQNVITPDTTVPAEDNPR